MSIAAAEQPASSIRQELHDLSQPLTRLQWRLELGRRADEINELRETIEGALADSVELVQCIRRLRVAIENQLEEAHGRAA